MNTQLLTIHAGETRELVLINQANACYHFIQEENSTLRLHITSCFCVQRVIAAIAMELSMSVCPICPGAPGKVWLSAAEIL